MSTRYTDNLDSETLQKKKCYIQIIFFTIGKGHQAKNIVLRAKDEGALATQTLHSAVLRISKRDIYNKNLPWGTRIWLVRQGPLAV